MELGGRAGILILGFLVLVFGSILRRRNTDQLQYWFLGWVLLLVHLLVASVGAKLDAASQDVACAIGSIAMIFAAVSFMWAVCFATTDSRHRKLLFASLATAGLIYCSAVFWNGAASRILLLAVIGAATLAVIWLEWRIYSGSFPWLLSATCGSLTVAGAMTYCVWHGAYGSSVSVFEAGLFAATGIAFRVRFRRWSIGTTTATVGFLAWSGSLLGTMLLPMDISNALMLGATWNAPAYMAALGMILTVLEEQIQEAAEAGNRLSHQAHHDALTGLPNRVLLEDRLEQALARAQRNQTFAAVLCIDLDRFKQVNDTFGHHVGDLYLKEVVARLNSRVRASDTLARTGGDEFTAVVSDLPSSTAAMKVAEALLGTLNAPLMIQDCPLPATACIGVAVYPDDARDGENLRKAADQAMYRAKSRGRNQAECFSADARDALDIQKHLRKAIQQGGFEIVYQPQFFKDGTVACVEALLRFRHPTLGMIPPSRFIPIAEESGLIVPIGDWVLRQVCSQSVEWQRQFSVPLMVAVNVSALQFNRIGFADSVSKVLRETGVDPTLVELELTESLVMNNVEDSARQMQSLKLLGVKIAVDDFGTGYSSLSYLHRLPIDTLKVDRSFVEKIAEPGGTRPIVETIMSLARSLNLRTVAEGVENEQQLKIMRELDCDLIQGFLFSRPVSADHVSELLRARATSPTV